MAEHLLCKQGVVGSNPIVSTAKAQVRDLVVALAGVPGARRAIRVPLPCHDRQPRVLDRAPPDMRPS